MSPLRSSAGPAVCTNGTPSSTATICASEVLPSPGGPASSTWSSASPRAAGRLDRDRELLAQLRLPDELLEAPRPQRHLELVLGARGRASGSARASLTARRPPRRVARSAAAEQLLGASRPRRRRAAARPPAARSPSSSSPSRASSRGSASLGAARRTTIPSPIAAPTFSRSSTMIRSAVRLPTPETAWKNRASPAAIAPSTVLDRPRARAPRARASGRPPGRRAAAGRDRARPAPRTRPARARRRARSGARAASPRGRPADAGERLRRHREPVADAAAHAV